MLLCLWPRPAAVPPIRPIAWETPYAMDAALKKKGKEILSYYLLHFPKIMLRYFMSSCCGTVETI